MNGYDRIKKQYLSLESKDDVIKKIITFLMKRSNMNELYLKEEKNLNDMMKYIKDQAREKAVNNVSIIEDEQVYAWIVTYFSKSNDELGINKQITPATSTTKTTKNDDKEIDQLKLEF